MSCSTTLVTFTTLLCLLRSLPSRFTVMVVALEAWTWPIYASLVIFGFTRVVPRHCPSSAIAAATITAFPWPSPSQRSIAGLSTSARFVICILVEHTGYTFVASVDTLSISSVSTELDHRPRIFETALIVTCKSNLHGS